MVSFKVQVYVLKCLVLSTTQTYSVNCQVEEKLENIHIEDAGIIEL